MRKNYSGFTIIECIAALIILNGVILTVLLMFAAHEKAEEASLNLLKACYLSEGLMAAAANADDAVLRDLETDAVYGLEKILSETDVYSDFYFYLSYNELKNPDRTLFFTNNTDTDFPVLSGFISDFNYPPDFFYESDYDYFLQDAHAPFFMDETAIEPVSVLFAPDDGFDITAQNVSSAHLFIDITANNNIGCFPSGGARVMTRVRRKAPSYLICARAYGQDMRLLNEMCVFR